MIKYDEIFHYDQNPKDNIRIIGETYDNRLILCIQTHEHSLYKAKFTLFSNRCFKNSHSHNSNVSTSDKNHLSDSKKKLPYKFRDLIEISKPYPQNYVSGDLSCDQCYLHLTSLVFNKDKGRKVQKPKSKGFFSFLSSKPDFKSNEKDPNSYHFESIIYELSTMKRSKKFQFKESIVGLFLPQHNHFYFQKVDTQTDLLSLSNSSETTSSTASIAEDSSSNSLLENRNEMLHFVGSRLNHIVVTSKSDQKRLTLEKLRGGIHIPHILFWQFCRKDSILFIIYQNAEMNVLSQFQFPLYQSGTSLAESASVIKDNKLKNLSYKCLPIGRKESIFVQIPKYSVLPAELSFYPTINNSIFNSKNSVLPFFRHNFHRYSFFIAKYKSKLCLVQQLFTNKESCMSFNVSCYPKFFNRNFSVPGVSSMLPLTFMQKESILIVFIPNQFICLIDISLTPPNVSILPSIYAEPRVYQQDPTLTIDLIERNRVFTKSFPSFSTNLHLPNIVVDLESPAFCKLYMIDIDLTTIDTDLQKVTRTSCDAFANICARLLDNPDQLASMFSILYKMGNVQNTIIFIRDFFLYSRAIRDNLFNSEIKKLCDSIRMTKSISKLSVSSRSHGSSNTDLSNELERPSSPLSPRFNSSEIWFQKSKAISSLPRQKATSTYFYRPNANRSEKKISNDDIISADSYDAQKDLLSTDSSSDDTDWKKDKIKTASLNNFDSDLSDSDSSDSSSDMNLSEKFGEQEFCLDDFSLSMKMKKIIRKSVHENESLFPSSTRITRRHYFYLLLNYFIENKEKLIDTSGKLHDNYALKAIECLEKQNKTSKLISDSFFIWFEKFKNENDEKAINEWILTFTLLLQSEICLISLPRVPLISKELVHISNSLCPMTISASFLSPLNVSPHILNHDELDDNKNGVSCFTFQSLTNVTKDQLSFWRNYSESLWEDQCPRVKKYKRVIKIRSSHFEENKKRFLSKRTK